MADAKKGAESAQAEAAPKKSNKLMIIIIAAVLVLALAGGGAFFMMKKNAAHDEEDGGEDAPPAKEQKTKKIKKDHAAAGQPIFVKLESFVVKLQSEGQDAYLQAVPELRVIDSHLADTIKQYNPEIRHKVLLILSGKKASEISTPQGVQKLSNEMRVAINGVIDPSTRKKAGKEEEPPDQAEPDDPVQAVLFTSFIVQ